MRCHLSTNPNPGRNMGIVQFCATIFDFSPVPSDKWHCKTTCPRSHFQHFYLSWTVGQPLRSSPALRPRQNCCHFTDDIFKCIFLMKMCEFCLRFHLSLFLRLHLTINQHWFRKWLVAIQATSHYLSQWWLVYWRIYASLSFNELMRCFIQP